MIADIAKPTDNVKRLAVSKGYHTLQYISDKLITSDDRTHGSSRYDLIFEAFKKATECGDENYVLALVPDLLKDTRFLKAFKKEINNNVILQHLTDYTLERYESFDHWLNVRDYPYG